MKSLNNIFRIALRKVFGLEVFLTKNLTPSSAQQDAIKLVSVFQKFEIDMVIDIGANTGQFVSEIRRGGYEGKVVSFEPLSQAHRELLLSSVADHLWDVYPRCALGDHEGEVEINIAGNSESSSILPMLDAHQNAAPESAYQGKESACIKTLDSIAAEYLKDSRAPFLKIDTQGFEWEVLDGARNTLPHIQGILIELSLVPLYDGQYLWRDIIDRLEDLGFTLWSFKPVFSDPLSGRTLQVDGLFFRNS